MNSRFFTLYQYLGPLILTPLAFWLWWNTYEGNIILTLVAWLVPVLFAYIVPGVGTNILKVWEINTRYRLGNFRPHHGFVFGSATSMLAWLCHPHAAANVTDALQTAFIMGSVLGFWNLIYDIKAIKSGILSVYNQPWADGKDAEAIGMDYAPVFFAGFGMIYGLGIGIAEILQAKGVMSTAIAAGYLPLMLTVSIIVPVWAYWHSSYRKHGHSGCRPIEKSIDKQ